MHGLWSGGSVKVATLSSSEVGQGSWRPLRLWRNPLPLHRSLGIWSLVISARSAGVPVEPRRNRVFEVWIRMATSKPPALWDTFTIGRRKTRFLEPVSPAGSDQCAREGSGVFSTARRRSNRGGSGPHRVSVPVRALGSFLRGSFQRQLCLWRRGPECFSAREGSGVFSNGRQVRGCFLPTRSACVSVPVRALGSFLPGDGVRSGAGRGVWVSVPVRALGSFLRSRKPPSSRSWQPVSVPVRRVGAVK